MAERFLDMFQPCTLIPGVRGALNRVWGASTASTVKQGKKFIKQKLLEGLFKLTIQQHGNIIGLRHPLDGVTSREYKLLRFIQLTNFLQREESTSF
jgi:hypothetical protein